MLFGEYVRNERLSKNLSLRTFCKLLDEDPSNWSKIERGILLPPKDKQKIQKISHILQIDQNYLYDLAIVSAREIPEHIDNNILDLLPVFFRTVENIKPTREELEELIKDLQK